MNTETARALCDITSAFYRDNAASFSSTRHGAWAGWERALDQAGFTCENPPARVLDVACGNMRFLGFLEKRHPGRSFDYRAVDNCSALARSGTPADARPSAPVASGSRVPSGEAGECALVGELASAASSPSGGNASDALGLARGPERGKSPGASGRVDAPASASTVRFARVDIANALLGESLQAALAPALQGEPLADVAVCFGFFHHVPTARAREALMRALVRSVRPGGAVVVSLWQFANSPELARRARETDARARAELGLPQLDPGDYLLGWQNKPGAYRYCHSFTRQEADDLAACVAGEACEVARFEADGRTGNLNAYLVLRRTSAHG